MNKLLIIITGIGMLFTACNINNMHNEMSQQDQIALLGMEEALFLTIYYNDSLANHFNDTGFTQDSMCYYFDEHYHLHDSLFNMHHNNYSHGNGWDDHQCCGMMGNVMGNRENMGQTNFMQHMTNEHGQDGMGHHQEDHEFMDSLMTAHEQYHPGN